jgi:hypothetical protein
MVAQGATRDFNPDLPQSIIDRAMDRDPAAAAAEYLAQFRTDVEAFITREAVEKCVQPDLFERPPERKHSYVAFVDPSGGSSDAMTMAIAHREGETQILDVVRERKPPFSPEAVVEEYTSLMKQYRVSKVYGDRYGGEWPREQFSKRGVFYEPAEKPKSELYRDLLPLINSGAVDLRCGGCGGCGCWCVRVGGVHAEAEIASIMRQELMRIQVGNFTSASSRPSKPVWRRRSQQSADS